MHNPELNHESREVTNTIINVENSLYGPMFKGMTLKKLSLDDLVVLKTKVQAQIDAKRMVSLGKLVLGAR